MRLTTRLLGAALVLWAVATIVFVGIRLVPGDPALAILGGPGSQASAEALAAVRAEYGLDQPVLVQYGAFLGRLVTGDFGESYVLRRPVADVIGAQIGATLALAAASLVVAWAIAIGLALVSTGRSRWARSIGGGIETVAAALPQFWLASILVIVFATGLGWLPAVADGTPAGVVLPVLTLAIPVAGFLAQIMRESMLDALAAPFSLAARSRGESETGLRLRHALRHAAVPGVELSAWAFGYLVSGAVVVETMFAMPGLGRTLLQAVTLRDVPLVTAVVLVVALAYLVVTFLADVAATLIDPRRRDAETGDRPAPTPRAEVAA
nr:ABC transporter permease [Agromyces seonyuensis]